MCAPSESRNALVGTFRRRAKKKNAKLHVRDGVKIVFKRVQTIRLAFERTARDRGNVNVLLLLRDYIVFNIFIIIFHAFGGSA